MLSDLRKMTDAELISAASDMIYSKDIWQTGFDFSTEPKPAEEFLRLRDLIDELHYRHVIKKLSTAQPQVKLAPVKPAPAS